MKLTEDDIQVREFDTHDYRVQIKRELSNPCYQIKKQILENQENSTNYIQLASELSRHGIESHDKLVDIIKTLKAKARLYDQTIKDFPKTCRNMAENQKLRELIEEEIKKQNGWTDPYRLIRPVLESLLEKACDR